MEMEGTWRDIKMTEESNETVKGRDEKTEIPF